MRHQGTQQLETERLILRRFRPEDAPSVYANWASDEEATRYLTWPAHRSEEVSQGYVDFCVSHYAEDSFYQWAIVQKGAEGKENGPIGNISVVRMEDGIEAVELGWVLGRRFWGRGYMPEAAEALLRFFFEEVGANRVSAGHDAENGKSGRVMQKIGMHHEGTLRAAGRNNRGIVDMEIYGIVRADWEKERS